MDNQQISIYNKEDFIISSANKHNHFEMISFKQNNIKFLINVKNDNSYLSFSIPYDKGWKVFVDGKKETSRMINISLLGITINSGKHMIELKYIPPGFIVGLLISIFTLITLLTCLLLRRYKITSSMSTGINKYLNHKKSS